MCVVGLGYVGMTLALKLADSGERVIGVDRQAEIIKSLLKSQPHVTEPGLKALLDRHLGGHFLPRTEIPDSASSYIICVNTPVDSQGVPDISPLVSAAEAIGEHISSGNLVAVRSTVPPGTTRKCVLPALESPSGMKVGEDFRLCVAPERTVEGKALVELERLPQIIGGYDQDSSRLATELFSKVTNKVRTVSSMEAAEMIKLMDNCYRYATFAIGNELGLGCEMLGLDAREVIEAANWEYPRNDIKMPGAGVGGGCLPKDTRIMINALRGAGLEPKLLEACRNVNDGMPLHVFRRVEEFHSSQNITPEKSKILILGFAFKGRPQVNDTRHSPGGFLAGLLLEKGYRVWGHDPAVTDAQIASFGATPCLPAEGFSGATTVVTMNDNPSISELRLAELCETMSNPSMILDGWEVIDESKIGREGVVFRRLGNGSLRQGRK